ncbi:FHA domain-containing serine/threonine-protein kinase [Catenuloplanes japonicus]|uniref:FHA domain-containing serine/threonine-protein kinase n=1 Tax=Catenuloplanes japonicus TaxID=33876 RepID=UPI00068A200D|nr:FHA domain-containing serine/threonine-protein kinase [Catenuloplanes japonicus]
MDRAVLLTVDGRWGRTVTGPRRIVVGRGPRCDLRLDDPRVSREHCLLTIDPPHVEVRDLGSRHGTRHDDPPITDGARLRLGDTTIGVAIVPAALPGLTISHEAGRGAQGAVFLARDHDGVPVAVKILHDVGAPEQDRRMLRELHVVRALRHPNIVAFRASAADPVPHIVSAWCPGGTLQQFGVQTPARAVRLIRGVLDGLAYAHGTALLPDVPLADGTTRSARGLVHRDITPRNVLLDGDTPRIADFGLAKAFALAGRSGHTRTGEHGGSFGFMPRAQLFAYRDAEPAVDTWAAAATLYWMLTGSTPRDFPDGCDPAGVVMREQPVPLATRDDRLPTRLTRLVDEALSETRPMSAAELRDALDTVSPY